MCQFLFKIAYLSTIFKFSFRNGDKVMSALKLLAVLKGKEDGKATQLIILQ